MNRNLRSTENGEKFLAQFDFADGGIAASFVESIKLISHDEFHFGVLAELRSLAYESDRPLALFATRETANAPYFDITDRCSRPSAVAAGGKVGSEGPIANLIRDFAKLYGPGKALDHPHIESMKATKVRKLVVVDDIVGSGTRALAFVRWLSKDPTIKSWLSYGYIRFMVVTFAATEYGKFLLERNPLISEVRSNRIAENGRANWTAREREEYVGLCRRYAHKTSRHFWPLGYGSAMTMMVFQHKCPNTAPAIIWASSKTWLSLVHTRPEFDFETWPKNPAEADTIQRTLVSLGQPSLSEVQWMKYVSPRARIRFLLLAAIAKRRLKIDYLCAIADVSRVECNLLLRECHRFGWITLERRITEPGRAELKHARNLRLIPDEQVTLTDNIYVPQSFRGTGG